MQISAYIIAKNEAKYIQRCIKSLVHFDEIIVFLNGSTDSTEKIIEEIPKVKLIHGQFHNDFARLRNDAISHCANQYVFGLDGDEWITPEVYFDIQSIFSSTNILAIRFPRYNQLTPHTHVPRFYPDHQVRAINQDKVRYKRKIDEIVDAPGTAIRTSKYHIYHRGRIDIVRDTMNLYDRFLITGIGKETEEIHKMLKKSYIQLRAESIPTPKQHLPHVTKRGGE